MKSNDEAEAHAIDSANRKTHSFLTWMWNNWIWRAWNSKTYIDGLKIQKIYFLYLPVFIATLKFPLVVKAKSYSIAVQKYKHFIRELLQFNKFNLNWVLKPQQTFDTFSEYAWCVDAGCKGPHPVVSLFSNPRDCCTPGYFFNRPVSCTWFALKIFPEGRMNNECVLLIVYVKWKICIIHFQYSIFLSVSTRIKKNLIDGTHTSLARMRDIRFAYKILVGKSEGNGPLGELCELVGG
jgi:hypothetical protein